MPKWFEKRITLHRPIILEQLEERIVLDAAVDSGAQNTQENQQELPQDQGGISAHLESSENSEVHVGNQDGDPLAEIFKQDLSAVLVSNALDQLDALVDAVGDDVEVIVYDADQDDASEIVDSLGRLTEGDRPRDRAIGDLLSRRAGHGCLWETGSFGPLKPSWPILLRGSIWGVCSRTMRSSTCTDVPLPRGRRARSLWKLFPR